MNQGVFRSLIVFLAFVSVAAGFATYFFAFSSREKSTDVVANLVVERGPQCAATLEIEQEDFLPLYDMGMALGLEYPATFARVVDHLYDENRLPDCYLTKDQARSMGWRLGRTVATAVPSHSIGGDYFGNREGLLPAKYIGNYREADLDYDRGHRGASRLVYVQGRTDEGLIWVTTDHYDSFTKIYCGQRVCD